MGPQRGAVKVTVVGLLRNRPFHVAICAAEALKLKFPSKFADPVIQPLVEFAWHEYLEEKKKLLGDEKKMLKWAHHEWGYRDFKPKALYRAIAEDFYTKYLKSSQHVFVYLDIAIEEQPVGRLLFELFSNMCPRTCENFRALCCGEAKSLIDGRELTYKDSLFHRIVKNGWIQGGDIVSGKGDQGESIYGLTFEDENFSIHHKGRGVLGMANKGRHSNASQFYITLQPSPYLDKKYVAFGQLIEGTDVLQRLEAVPTDNERPTVPCKIINCGTFEP